MNQVYAQILTSPYCGKKKKILSLISGNIFGQVFWYGNLL